MPRLVRPTAFLILCLNIFCMVLLYMPSGEASSFNVYVNVQKVINDMAKSGAITIDETRKTQLDGWPDGYTGHPAAPIAHAAMKANKLHVMPLLLVAINSLSLLTIGICGQPVRAPASEPS